MGSFDCRLAGRAVPVPPPLCRSLHPCPAERLFPELISQASHGEREKEAFKILLDWFLRDRLFKPDTAVWHEVTVLAAPRVSPALPRVSQHRGAGNLLRKALSYGETKPKKLQAWFCVKSREK